MDDILKNFPNGITIEIIFFAFIILLRESLGFWRYFLDKQRQSKGKEITTDLDQIVKTLDVRTQQMATRSEQYDKLMPKIIDEIDNLHQMHQVRDSNGYPIWYQNPQQQIVLTKLVENMEKQGTVLVEIAHSMQIQNKDVLLAVNNVNVAIAQLQAEIKDLKNGR